MIYRVNILEYLKNSISYANSKQKLLVTKDQFGINTKYFLSYGIISCKIEIGAGWRLSKPSLATMILTTE